MNKESKGFTIVELLIVIVVIGILAAISIIAYNNVQQKARDSQRAQDIKTIAKALEMYYLDHGSYPPSGCGSNCPSPKVINTSWASTADGSWSILKNALVPKYISALPEDPRGGSVASISGGHSYDYVVPGASWCNSTPSGQLYLITYRLEASDQKKEVAGNCPGTNPSYGASQYLAVK